MCYILCMCVWAHQIRQLRLTIPHSSAQFVSCVLGAFLGGGGGGGVGMPPSWLHRVFGQHPKIFFFGRFLLFLAVY
jgi:hypothetical protein